MRNTCRQDVDLLVGGFCRAFRPGEGSEGGQTFFLQYPTGSGPRRKLSTTSAAAQTEGDWQDRYLCLSNVLLR